MQRGASENNVKQCLTAYRQPGEERKGKATGFSIFRLGDQREGDVNRSGEGCFGQQARKWFRVLDKRSRGGGVI